MRIASAAYQMSSLVNWEAFERKAENWVKSADADLLVFPEYGAMELATLDGPVSAGDLDASARSVSKHWPRAIKI